ncbi:MAG: YkgJ family cysteine cluster protein [Candidatus Helarchaeota archaeon]
MQDQLRRFVSKRIKESSFNCKNCGLCCKTATVMMSSREIGGISYVLGIDRNDFIKKFLELKEIKKIKKFGNNIYEISGKCYVIKKENGLCPFYKENNGTSFCEIYNSRPIVCRLFPYTWEYNSDNNSVNIDYSESGWNDCPGIEKNSTSNWDDIKNEITGAVILSIIQTNELQIENSVIQKRIK